MRTCDQSCRNGGQGHLGEQEANPGTGDDSGHLGDANAPRRDEYLASGTRIDSPPGPAVRGLGRLAADSGVKAGARLE